MIIDHDEINAMKSGQASSAPELNARPQSTRNSNPDITRILKIRVPAIVRLAERKMSLDEIIGLSPGSIIEFEKPGQSDMDLLINNSVVGAGQTVKIGENFGLRITAIRDVPQRIKSLRG